MKKTLIIILLALFSTTYLYAVPARPRPFVVTQSDGTSLTVLLRGDEHQHFFSTLDGIPLIRTAEGDFHYAVLDEDTLKASDYLAHEPGQRSAAELVFATQKENLLAVLTKKARAKMNARNISRAKRLPARNIQTSEQPRNLTGQRRGLIILVNFSDKKFTGTNPQSVFNALANEESYSQNGSVGSVRDYFRAQSYGQLTIDFDVVGPVTLSQKMSYYGGNDSDGNDLRPGQMAAEACLAVNSLVDFSDYDWTGNGEVDQVFIVYAGYGEASGASENTIWPHEWELQSSDYGKSLTLDGVRVNTYACGPELYGTSGNTIDGIGTICHEFSHCLGFPDLYDVDYSGGFGMDAWSVMDAGSYNGDGYVPCGYTSYERWMAGWLEPVVLDKATKVTDMQPVTSTPEAYIIYNDAHPDEYYLLENRQLESFDSELYGHGLLVLHVDYDKTIWNQNAVNDTKSHQHLTIIPADNQFMSGSYYGDSYATAQDLAGDPFPGTKGNTALTDASSPAASLYNAAPDGRRYMGKPIENITENANGLIGFDFMGGVFVEVPVPQTTTNIRNDSFTANWSKVSAALSYSLEIREATSGTPEESIMLAEDFSGFASETKDGSTDISTSLDHYMHITGWTGTKLYASPSRIKMGSSKAAGTLVTPILKAPASGCVTVELDELTYGSVSSTTLDVQLLSTGGTKLQSCQFTATGGKYTAVFENVETDYKICISPAKRIYLCSVTIYDRSFSQEDLADYRARRKTSTGTLVEDIAATSHTFTGLTPGSCYRWRVKAVALDGESAWSAWTEVQLGTTDGLGTTILSSKNSGTAVPTYDLNGRRICQPTRPGIYVSGNRKILVR